ncbi:MAG: DUF1295 domain-containing protein [Bacteroidales bacterium]|nr:DUF1295 domain-containing protein [Bacteroidales bacterium]
MMIKEDLFNELVWLWILIGIVIFPIMLFVKVPYGRHTDKSWGATINNKLGWIIMELPALAVFMYFFLKGEKNQSAVVWVFFGFWLFHYVNRTFIYPLRTKTAKKQIPFLIVFLAIFFNSVNGFLNGYYFSELHTNYDISWLYDARFIIGSLMFIFGMTVNRIADRDLMNLRKPGETGYKIPQTKIFKLVSCPNHGGEMLEWAGFAVLTWSLPALAFAVWTVSNVLPRSLAHHKWYKSHFPDYPKNRKAVIPYIL